MSDESPSKSRPAALLDDLIEFEVEWSQWRTGMPVPSLRACWKKARESRIEASDQDWDWFCYSLLAFEVFHRKRHTLELRMMEEQLDEIGRVGPYRLLKLLGAGGMGIVFEAEDIRLGRRVALKVMLPSVAMNHPNARSRFLKEARFASQITNEYVVKINAVSRDNDHVPFIDMELLQGEPLEDRIGRGDRMEVPEILDVGRQIARGLEAAHKKDLVHRDIKPANIWLELDPRDHVKILDFGLARSLQEEFNLTLSGQPLGTPLYMSPEQARSGKVDRRSDLFSLGVVLYRLAAGRLPFGGSTALEVIVAVLRDTPEAVSVHNPTLPQRLTELIMRLLEKDPTRRPRSACQVGDALESLASPKAAHRSSATPAAETDGLEVDDATIPGAEDQDADSASQRGNGVEETRMFNVPGPPTEFFTGRAKKVEECHHLLRRYQRVAIFGPSGIGKTEVALAYVRDYAATYQWVIWASAESPRRLTEECGKLVGRSSPPNRDPIAALRGYLEEVDRMEEMGRWLLVLDDVKEPDVVDVVSALLPESANGHVMFTMDVLPTKGLAEPLPIQPLVADEGATLLLRRAGRLGPDEQLDGSTIDRDFAQRVSSLLMGSPLALTLAGAFVAQVSRNDHFDEYADTVLLNLRPESWTQVVTDTAFWALGEIRSSAASHLFAFFARGDFHQVPEDVVVRAGRLAEGIDGQSIYGSGEFDEAIEALCRFSLLRRNVFTGTISMHRLLRDVPTRDFEIPGDDERAVLIACALLDSLHVSDLGREADPLRESMSRLVKECWEVLDPRVLQKYLTKFFRDFSVGEFHLLDDFGLEFVEWASRLAQDDPIWKSVPGFGSWFRGARSHIRQRSRWWNRPKRHYGR